MSTLGKRTKLARESLGFSQEEFAKELGGVHLLILRDLENDDYSPPAQLFGAMCIVLEVSPSWLMVGEGEMKLKSHCRLTDEEKSRMPLLALYSSSRARL